MCSIEIQQLFFFFFASASAFEIQAATIIEWYYWLGRNLFSVFARVILPSVTRRGIAKIIDLVLHNFGVFAAMKRKVC